MRVALAMGVLLVVGGSGIYYFPNDTQEPFFETFISLAQKRPEFVTSHVENAIDECVPKNLQMHYAAAPVKKLAAETVARSMLLTAEQKSSDEASRELVPWVLDSAKRLSPNEKDAYLNLTRLLNSTPVTLCIMTNLKTSTMFRLQSEANSWEIRSSL